jgi:hypothetical protein
MKDSHTSSSMTRSFLMTFMAYILFVDFSSTIRTLAYDPRPITLRMLKSAREIRDSATGLVPWR